MSLTDGDLRGRLRALPAELPRRDVGPAFTDTVRAGARRRRTRSRVVGAAALVVLVAAGLVMLPWLRGDDERGVVPADRTPPAGATVFGVSVGWLPDGLVTAGSSFQEVFGRDQMDSKLYPEQHVRFAGAADAEQVRSGAKPVLSGPEYAVTVRRGAVQTVEQFVDRGRRGGRLITLETVTVAGRSASLVYVEVPGPRRLTGWSVYLEDDPTVQVRISGPDRETVLRISASVTIGPAAGPARPEAAIEQIRSAVAAAFTGATGIDMLTAVADDGYARTALERALTTAPGPVRSTTVKEIGPVTFLSDTEAAISVTLTDGTDALGINPQMVYADGAWRVTRASYCGSMLRSLSGCPTIP